MERAFYSSVELFFVVFYCEPTKATKLVLIMGLAELQFLEVVFPFHSDDYTNSHEACDLF